MPRSHINPEILHKEVCPSITLTAQCCGDRRLKRLQDSCLAETAANNSGILFQVLWKAKIHSQRCPLTSTGVLLITFLFSVAIQHP